MLLEGTGTPRETWAQENEAHRDSGSSAHKSRYNDVASRHTYAGKWRAPSMCLVCVPGSSDGMWLRASLRWKCKAPCFRLEAPPPACLCVSLLGAARASAADAKQGKCEAKRSGAAMLVCCDFSSRSLFISSKYAHIHSQGTFDFLGGLGSSLVVSLCAACCGVGARRTQSKSAASARPPRSAFLPSLVPSTGWGN